MADAGGADRVFCDDDAADSVSPASSFPAGEDPYAGAEAEAEGESDGPQDQREEAPTGLCCPDSGFPTFQKFRFFMAKNKKFIE